MKQIFNHKRRGSEQGTGLYHKRPLFTTLLLSFALTFLALSIAQPWHQAKAATRYMAEARAQFLSGSLLSFIDLSRILGLEGASATYIDSQTTGTSVIEKASLDITALSLLELDLGSGITLPDGFLLGDLISLGAVNQYAEAMQGGTARAATGAVSDGGAIDVGGSQGFPADASLNLLNLLNLLPTPVADTILTEASINLRALSSAAQHDATTGTSLATSCADISNPENCLDYNIADASIDLTSPLVSSLTGVINSAVATLTTTVNGLSDLLLKDIVGSITGALDQIGGLLSGLSGGTLGITDNDIKVSLNANLTQALSTILNGPVDLDGIIIDLSRGTISIDLARVLDLDLSNLPPNTSLLSADNLITIVERLTGALDDLQDQITTTLRTALDAVRLEITGGVCLVSFTDPIFGITNCLAGINLDYADTLGALTSNKTQIRVSGSGLAAAATSALSLVLGLVQGVVLDLIDTTLTNGLSALSGTIEAALTPILSALSPILSGLSEVLDLSANLQEHTAEAHTVTATRLTLLGLLSDAGALSLDLAQSSVYASAIPYDVTLTATNTRVGKNTYVDGSGWPADIAVVLQLQNADGSLNIGDPITVTADSSGNLPQTTIPILSSMASGTYRVQATDIAAGGLETTYAAFEVGASDAPVILVPANGSTLSTQTITISGRGLLGNTITVYDQDNNVLCDNVIGQTGDTWSCTATVAADGPYTITATQTLPDGTPSEHSSPISFVVDTAPPAAPIILTPADDTITNDNTPTFTGTGEVGATLNLSDGTNTICTATVQLDSTWACTLYPALTDGTYTVSATQNGPAGNTSNQSNTVNITVDATPPVAPVIESPTNGITTTNPSIVISGTGEAGDNLVVKSGSTTICTTTVQANGTWTCTPSSALADGTYTLVASQAGPAGNYSPPSTPVVVTIDTTAPPAPIITSPTNGDTIYTDTPTITGTAEPGATINLIVDDQNLSTTVDGEGNWSIPVTSALVDGTYTISATATDAHGNGPSAATTSEFTIDTSAPRITAPADGTVTNDLQISGTGIPDSTINVTASGGEAVCTATVEDDGSWTCTAALPDGTYDISATQTPTGGDMSEPGNSITATLDTTAPDAPVISYPTDTSDPTNDATPTIIGTGEPGATVVVTDGATGETICTTTVRQNSGWTCIPSAPLDDGDHTLTATQTDPAGNTSPGTTTEITIDTTAPPALAITIPADNSTIDTTVPTISGTGGEAGDHLVIKDGDTVICEAEVEGDAWFCTPGAPLSETTHTLTATQTDPAGNTSDPTNSTVTITVDVTVPQDPVVTYPADGSTIGDTTPVITGTAEPNTSIEVFIGGASQGKTTVDAEGNWEFETPVLENGYHQVYATSTDAAEHTATSSVNDFTIDTSAPTITSPTNNSTTNSKDISGTGVPNGTIIVTNSDGTPICNAIIDSNGHWTCTTATLTDGPHTITAHQTPQGDDTETSSTPVTFTLDTTAPAAPIIEEPEDDTITNIAVQTISGTAEPDYPVTVQDNGTTICTTTADSNGDWTCDPVTLSETTHTLTATQTDPAGNTSDPDTATITIDLTQPLPPAITNPADGSTSTDSTPELSGTGEPGATVEVTDDSGAQICEAEVQPGGGWSCSPTTPLPDGDHTLTATQTDPAGNTSDPSAPPITISVDASTTDPTITSPADGSHINTPTPPISGTAEPNSTITISVDGQSIGTTTTNPNGVWSTTAPTSLADGDHTVSIIATDASGNASGPVENNFVLDTVPPATLTIDYPINGSTITDRTPTISGTTDPNTEVDVYVDSVVVPATLIQTLRLPSDVLLETTMSDASGNWSITSDLLARGDRTATAVATDLAGNTREVSTTFRLEPRTRPDTPGSSGPAAPTITSPSAGSELTNDQTPTISGTGEPGATATVTDSDGTVVCQTTVDASGNWSCTASEFAPGPHTISATQTDTSGATSTPSTPISFTIILFKEEVDPVFYDPEVPSTGYGSQQPIDMVLPVGIPSALLVILGAPYITRRLIRYKNSRH